MKDGARGCVNTGPSRRGRLAVSRWGRSTGRGAHPWVRRGGRSGGGGWGRRRRAIGDDIGGRRGVPLTPAASRLRTQTRAVTMVCAF